MTLRTREYKEQEDHNQYSHGFRDECQWYQDSEVVNLSAQRGTLNISGPHDMSMFVKEQMLMDAVSWALFWEKRHEFDPFIRWQADFIRYVFGWLTQSEEDDFVKTQKAVYNDMTVRKHQSQYFHVSKALSKFLRHSEMLYLFNTEGTVNIGSLFNELAENNPIQRQMSPRDFAASLLCNDKSRFQVNVFVNWTWKPFRIPPTQPWDLRIGDTPTRLLIHILFIILSRLKSQIVLVGFSMSQVQTTDNPLDETDC